MFSPQKTIVSIDLKGMIASGSRAPLNMDNLNGLFSKLMKMKFNALSIVINSPGGSPVQSSLIAQKIREISAKKKVKCYCFVEDVAASGGYWLACAADEIYADINSINEYKNRIKSFKPEIVIHLASQPLVLESYNDTRKTFSTNVMGTINLLETLK